MAATYSIVHDILYCTVLFYKIDIALAELGDEVACKFFGVFAVDNLELTSQEGL